VDHSLPAPGSPDDSSGPAAEPATDPGGARPGRGREAAGASGRGRAGGQRRPAEAGSGTARRGRGVSFERRFTRPGVHPFESVQWERRTAVIANEKGETVFEQRDCEVPASWSQMATNVVVSKYFRGPLGSPRRETSVRQVISRVCDTIAAWGLESGHLAGPDAARAFQDELTHLVLHQMMSFNSPVWFNVGVPGTRPQASACFINSVEDTMDSILRLAHTEGMLFKYGSGTGTNLSTIRSSRESLAGGGTASGPVSFMRGFDAFAGVIKSGGTTRRAAKMVILNVDHPDIREFITCKVTEERKAWALIDAGYDGSFTGEAYGSIFFQNSNNSVRVTDDFMRAVIEDREWHLRAVTDPQRILGTARARELMRLMAESAHQCGDPGIQYDTTINDWHTSANSGRINASNPCFTGDSRILTEQGWMRIDRLVGEGVEGNFVKVLRRDGSASTPTQLMCTGMNPVLAVTLSDGRQLRTTPNHTWILADGTRKSADSLAVGDEVSVLAQPVEYQGRPELPVEVHRPLGERALPVMPEEWSPRLGELVGHLVGDGCVDATTGATIWAYGTHPDEDMCLADVHKDWLETLFSVEVSDSMVGDRRRQLRISHGAVGRFFEALGVTSARAHDRRAPEAIFTAPRDVVTAFLRGYFGAEGTVHGHADMGECEVSAGSCSLGLLRDVQVLLQLFGVRATIESAREAAARDALGCATRELHRLRIHTADHARFRHHIGFSVGCKRGRLEELLASPRMCKADDWHVTVARVDAAGEELTFNLTEPVDHSVWAGGIFIAQCSEYMYLDDSACNLASLNLMRFVREDGTFDVTAFRHAVAITITAMEILVSNASYPTERIAENSERFRPLGLGYANLGALLMARGVPYDSPQGRELAACITAIMTGEAYAQSARIAREVGPFAGYPENRQPMLRVIGKHREAAYRIPDDHVESQLLTAARRAWDEAHELGAVHGYRNGQSSVLAPTGTIGFMMDCDTTGVEPDIALVKYKKLVGGGMLKLVNGTVPLALRRLGYGEAAVKDIVAHIDAKDTIEGAPHLREEDLAVFDCAFRPAGGSRSIAWQGHLRMIGAVQPFLSGAISKTVNMPQEATVDDIERAYLDGWKMGLKALAIYRDGSKRSQPVGTTIDKTTGARQAITERPLRRRLPAERQALTHKFEIAGHEGYITVGLYEDGNPGEIFVKMAKEGSTVSGLMDSFATAISLALQYGVPLKVLVDKFSHTRFEPSGYTGNPEIPIAKSIMDYIFRWLASRFLPWEERDALGIIRRDGTEPGDEPEVETRISATPARAATARAEVPVVSRTAPTAFLNQEDAPSCSDCGSLMVRSGACYKCLNCGATSGCS
jgi:ribonucleoside-diphosphate reductase alpha chain